MILRIQSLFKVVEKLHNLELYDDLCLFAGLHLPNEPAKMFLDCEDEFEDDQRGYLLYCLANACAHLNNFPQAIRNYEMAIRYLGNIRQRKLQNRYEHVLNSAELRFQMHKIFLQNRQEDEALRCLESVPRAELTPKVLLAMAHLCHQLAKTPSLTSRPVFNKRTDAPNTRILNYFKAIVKDVPEAIYCQSKLISVGAIKAPLVSPPKAEQNHPTSAAADEQQRSAEGGDGGNFVSIESRIWAEAKQMHARKCYLEAAKLLDNAPGGANLRFLLEQARLYRLAGDQQKALACYQQAHLMDSTSAKGMDTFAALLATQNNSQQTQRELDSLAHKMLHSNPRRPESFVIYGWVQRQCHRVAEAKQFAQRAEQLAGKRGKQRCEAFLLKAQLLFDTKRHYKEMETVLADALYNDGENTAVYALYMQMFIAQKRYAEAQRMARASMKFVGEQNHQIRFLQAQALAEDSAGGGQSGTEQAIGMLEKMVQEGHFLSLDPLLLLSRLYDRQQKYEKAIALLNRFKESYGDPRIHRELGDLLSKTNRPGEALGEYGQAMGGGDLSKKERMINLMGGFTTPQSAVNAAFENGGGGNAGVGGAGASSSGPAERRPTRMPPPVARVTRRTAINQHEQLRRLRGMGTLSATGSMVGGSSSSGSGRTQIRRMVTRSTVGGAGGSSGSSRLTVTSNISPILAPLHFDDDQQQQQQQADSDEGSDDSSQLSLDEADEDEEAAAAANADSEHNNSSSSALEQSRASNGGASGDRAAIRQASIMVRDIQRYLVAARGGGAPSPTAMPSAPSSTTTLPSITAPSQGTMPTTTTTVQQRPASLGGAMDAGGIDDDADFVPLVADEPLLEGEMGDGEEEEESSRMSIDNGGAIGGDMDDDEEEDEDIAAGYYEEDEGEGDEEMNTTN